MAWSPELQEVRDRLTDALIDLCREEVRPKRVVTAETDPSRELGICEEDLDDLQIAAAERVGLRPPYHGETLVIPWHGPERETSIADLAAWLAVNGRPLAQS